MARIGKWSDVSTAGQLSCRTVAYHLKVNLRVEHQILLFFVFVQHQQKTVEPYQMRAVVNLEAHTYDQYHLDETDLFINYHSEADVVVTYGYELRPLFWLRDAFCDGDVLNLNKSIFNKWCCATY